MKLRWLKSLINNFGFRSGYWKPTNYGSRSKKQNDYGSDRMRIWNTAATFAESMNNYISVACQNSGFLSEPALAPWRRLRHVCSSVPDSIFFITDLDPWIHISEYWILILESPI